MISIKGNKNHAICVDFDGVPARELPTYLPLLWFHLPEGPRRDALRVEQEKPGYKYFNR
jgi:hypothetical protein